jgi:hypothetical protein
MRNQYIGDSIDYVKYCLLRIFINHGCTLGINWYLNSDNTTADIIDGAIVSEHDIPGDREFFRELNALTSVKARKISDVEQSNLLPGAVYFGEIIDRGVDDSARYEEQRSLWNSLALRKLSDCSLVYLDPDEGIATSKDGYETSKLNGYATYDEILEYYKRGQSVIIYQNGEGIADESLRKLISGLAVHLEVDPEIIHVLLYDQFHKHYYLIIPAKQEYDSYKKCIEGSLKGEYFQEFIV